MMRWIIPFSTVVFIILFSYSVLAFEENKTKYFGVGATVEEVEQATFMVQTEGEKAGEGFVYTPESVQSGEKITFHVSLKGEGTVLLKIVETDSKGKFLTETTSPNILLTGEWKAYNLTTQLKSNTSQIDVLVVTDSKQKTNFQFRDAMINTKK